MPTFQCGEFRVWFGTDDAPGPAGSVSRSAEYAVRVGVLPRTPELAVRIRYRRQGGVWMVLPAPALSDAGGDTPQYYEGVFRDLAPGAAIEYTVQCQLQGRLVKPRDSTTLSFEVERSARRGPGDRPVARTFALESDGGMRYDAADAGVLELPGQPPTTPTPEVTRVRRMARATTEPPVLAAPNAGGFVTSGPEPLVEAPSVVTNGATSSPFVATSLLGLLPQVAMKVPDVEVAPLFIAATFGIFTFDPDLKISQRDFRFYELSAEVSGAGAFKVLRGTFDADQSSTCRTVPAGSSGEEPNPPKHLCTTHVRFPAGPRVVRAGTPAWVRVIVKSFEGARVWSREYRADDPLLHDLYIEVPLQRPIVLTSSGKKPKSTNEKKLRGQVLELSKTCSLKDLTVLIQAKARGDALWRIVAAGKTDSTGNFSLPYPFGVFDEAQALVSAKPDSPATVRVTDVKNGNETIADDFLYLLLKDFTCPDHEGDTDCDCHKTKRPGRLPDQADLIGSDEYTQDIGGSCINLSTPNRTLSEFNYLAIVRTSDPDVANYTLTKTDGVTAAGIDPVRKLELSRALAALDSGLRDATLRGALPAAVLSTASAQFVALRNLIEYGATVDVAAALRSVDALIAGLIASRTETALGALPPGTTAGGVSTETIEKDIDSAVKALVLNSHLAPGVGFNQDSKWKALEGAIRQAVINAGGATLTPTFFDQFPGWGVSTADQIYNSAQVYNSGLLRQVILKAAEAAVFGVNTRSAGVPIALPPGVNAVSYFVGLANDVKSNLTAAQLVRSDTSYTLVPGATKRQRQRVDLDNLVAWQDDQRSMTLFQAVTVATGHVLYYKSEFRADGYSLGDLVYSLPLAPGQTKQIVVLDASHRLMGTETQSLSQAERLAAGMLDERTVISGLGGRIGESVRGASSANTSGISAGFGTGGQGYGGGSGGQGGQSGGYGGSGSAVLGIAGGVANANSNAWQYSSRDISQHFEETLRQSIMQNADAYRQLNASLVTTVEEGQRYGVTSEVVANHNHCHALTIMYFEVLRHYAIFQRLSSVEECVFVPLLMTNFTAENIYKWRDVLANSLLPIPADNYLHTLATATPYQPQQHPLVRAFDANERILTGYANVDYPVGSFDDETIQFIRGTMRVRVELPRPRTRFDRIISLPVTKQLDQAALADAVAKFSTDSASYAAKAAFTAGLWTAFNEPPTPPNPQEFQVLATEAISNAFMTMDANYASVPPAQSMRIVNFKPGPISFAGAFPTLVPVVSSEEFFADNFDDRKQWQAYAQILGYSDVETMLNAYFKGNLIAEWDQIFYTDIAPLVFEKIVSRIALSEFSTDFSSDSRYRGGEKSMRLSLTGAASKKRNQLPLELKLTISDQNFKKLREYITFTVEDLSISYSTAHYNGVLYTGNVNDDLFDDTSLYIPETSDEKRNPRKEDAYLVYRLIDHLNSNIEHYNKALWYNLDPDRRYMLLDGFDIQIFNDYGLPIGSRSLASVVKNELLTITGNSMVLPVAAGYRVSQSYIVEESADGPEVVSLLDHYQPLTPVEPYRISVPTRGVFAEAVQGACNACEKIETDRLQDWNKFPNTDQPTAISPITVPTPEVTDWKAAFREFATALVSMQSPPAAPAPGAGLAGLSEALTKSGVFKDITGLDANQQNVIRTYLSNQENARAFGEMAKEMAMQQHNTENSGRITDQIAAAKQSGNISKQEAGQLTKDHIQQQIGGNPKEAVTSAAQKKIDLINDTQKANAIKPGAAQALNEDVLRGLIPGNNSKTSVDAVTGLLDKVGDVGEVEMAADGGFRVVNAALPGRTSGKTAPAHKTGLSGLGSDHGTPTPLAKRLLEGSEGALEILGDAVAKWKAEPDTSLTDAMLDTLGDAALEAADEITDEIPLVKAMKLAMKYSLVFADGVGYGIDQASADLGVKYKRGTDYSETGDGLSEDDVAAIDFVRRWLLNDVKRLNSILLQGISAAVRKAGTEFADWLSSASTRKLFTWTTSLTTHVINKTPINGLALEIVNATADQLPETRREAYGLALSLVFGLFVRQLENANLRRKLQPLIDARGAREFDKAVVKAIASCLVEGTLGDPKANDGSSFISNLREEGRTWTLQRLNELISNLPNGISVAPTNGALKIVGDEIRIPAALLRDIELADAGGASSALDRALTVSTAIAPARKAAAANLLLLARVRQPQIVKLSQSGGNSDAQAAAYMAYWEEVVKVCQSVTQLYLTAGGDPDVESSDSIRVETFDLADPQVWRERHYQLVGRDGGGRGAFSNSSVIWRGTKADISGPENADTATV